MAYTITDYLIWGVAAYLIINYFHLLGSEEEDAVVSPSGLGIAKLKPDPEPKVDRTKILPSLPFINRRGGNFAYRQDTIINKPVPPPVPTPKAPEPQPKAPEPKAKATEPTPKVVPKSQTATVTPKVQPAVSKQIPSPAPAPKATSTLVKAAYFGDDLVPEITMNDSKLVQPGR